MGFLPFPASERRSRRPFSHTFMAERSYFSVGLVVEDTIHPSSEPSP